MKYFLKSDTLQQNDFDQKFTLNCLPFHYFVQEVNEIKYPWTQEELHVHVLISFLDTRFHWLPVQNSRIAYDKEGKHLIKTISWESTCIPFQKLEIYIISSKLTSVMSDNNVIMNCSFSLELKLDSNDLNSSKHWFEQEKKR